MKKLIFAIALLCLLAFIAYTIMAPRSYDGYMHGTIVNSEESLAGFDVIFLEYVHIENGEVFGIATLSRGHNDISQSVITGKISSSGRMKLLCPFKDEWAGTLEFVGTVKWEIDLYGDDIIHGTLTVTQTSNGDGPMSPYKDTWINLQPWYEN